MLPIETNRLILRDFETDEFPVFYETTNDPEYRNYYSEHEMTRALWKQILERILSSAREPNWTKYQIDIWMQTGELIGTCGVRIEGTEHQQASFGCALPRAYWGKGFGYEASKRIISFGFSSLPIHRIYAETISENVRTRALAELLGMRLEGELMHHKFFKSRWWETVIYAILRDEWNHNTIYNWTGLMVFKPVAQVS